MKALNNPTSSRQTPEQQKPGSESARVDRPHDFGISPSDTNEVKYASRAALDQDPGRREVRSSDERGGRRDIGVGVDAGGAGAGSGGDLDLDIVGVGTHGSGITQSGPTKRENLQQHIFSGRLDHDRPAGKDQISADTGDSNSNPAPQLEIQGATGADAIRTDATGDPFQDATAGEISSDESNGADNDEGVELNDDNA